VLAKDLIRRIRRIEITTRRVVNQTLAGQYASVFKGRGMAFDEVRLYQPGDDIRAIDWNVTARMNEAYVKVFTEERELTVIILVDVSGSQQFGTQEKSKEEVAAEIAALVAFSAITNNDRVGLILFSDEVEKFVPPKKGRKHVLRLVSDILSYRSKRRGTNISHALEFLLGVTNRTSVCFLISDFIATDFERALKIANRRHDLIPVALRDPAEESLPGHGLAVVEDAETGERGYVDLSSPLVRETYLANIRTRQDARQKLFAKLRLDSVELRTGDEYMRPLMAFFRARARRLAA
jgi:uncharacterized protein (DUF58 family)